MTRFSEQVETPRPHDPESPLSATSLRVAHEVSATEAEGPGRRYAIWFQGCPLRCPGCCNPELLPFTGGRATTVDHVLARVAIAARQETIEGLSLLGGEPFAHASAAAGIAEGAQALGLSVMIYSGYPLSALTQRTDPHTSRLLRATDLLVDGAYDRRRPDTRRRWIGSTNQQLHFLTGRYTADDPRFVAPETLELRLSAGVLTINGRPWGEALP